MYTFLEVTELTNSFHSRHPTSTSTSVIELMKFITREIKLSTNLYFNNASFLGDKKIQISIFWCLRSKEMNINIGLIS